MAEHLEPTHFSNPIHQWIWNTARQYRVFYGGFPSIGYLDSLAQQSADGQLLSAVVSQVRHAVITDEPAVRHDAVEFLRRRLFEAAFNDSKDLYNSGRATEAYERMRRAMDALDRVATHRVDRSWLAEGFVDRHIQRQDVLYQGRLVCTGIPALDAILDGGAWPGFLGVWLAYPKRGKTTLLINLASVAIRASRKKVLYIPLEGGARLVEARFDAIFSDESYRRVKRGEMDVQRYLRAQDEYRMLRRSCVIRAFSEDWTVSVLNIQRELDDLARTEGWTPDMIVVDYGQLLAGRAPPYASKSDEQIAVHRDLKTLSERAKVPIWSAVQAQRPDKEAHLIPAILTAAQVAECYGIARIVDFMGSINQTDPERDQGVMRLFVELVRDAPANELITVAADFDRMVIGPAPAQAIPGPSASQPAPPKKKAAAPLGYGATLMVPTKSGV